MSCNAGRPHKTSKNTDTSKNRHHHCWCYVFITQEKHISSAVRTELDLRGDVSGSTASSHATDHELLEIKVRTLLHCLPAGCPVFVPVKWVMPVLLFLRPECWFLCGYYFKVNLLLWQNKQPTLCDTDNGFPAREMISEETRAEILYWSRVTTQTWIVHLIGSKLASTN